ncbi:MAG: hypothetical protein IT422_15725 [Pirellulaceae bacterium]|nr:hypothetical protein [Pirellulaceae bacterium]
MFGPTEDLLNQPEQQKKPPGAKEAFNFFAFILIFACRVVGVFWAIISKKFGSVGTRVYALDVLWAIPLLLALRVNDWYPDKYAFETMFIVLVAGFMLHLAATLKQKQHIHTKYVGDTRGGGLGEFVVWAALTGGFLAAGMVPTACFITTSMVCHHLFLTAIQERDRQRAVMIADSMAEQRYMMENFERYNPG